MPLFFLYIRKKNIWLSIYVILLTIPAFGQIDIPVKTEQVPFLRISKTIPAAKTNATASGCITSTFFKHFTAVGQKVNIIEVQTLQNGNFLLVGNITLASSQREGLLCIMSNSGNVISQNQLRINNTPLSVYALKVKANGKFLIAGVLHDIATEKVFIAQVNSDLTTDWLKLIDVPSAAADIKLDCANNGDVFFAAKLSNSIFCSLMDISGIPVWSKTLSPAGLDGLVGIGHVDFGEISILTNCTRAGIKVVEHTTISQATGANITTPYTLGNGTEENYFTRLTSYANRVIFSGVKKNNAAQFKLTRNISFGSPGIETEHTYTIPGVVDFNTSSAMDNAGDAMGFCFPAQGRLVFIRQFAAYSTDLDFTREYTVPVGSNISSVTRSVLDGGFLFALNRADSGEFILIKTDSIGTLPSCGFQTISNTFTETLNLQNTAAASTSGNASNNAVTASLSLSNAGLNNTSDCNETYCPPDPPEDTCMATYVKLLRSNSHYDAFNSFYLMRNNIKLMVTGRYNRIWNENLLTYGLKRFDEKGNFINGVNLPPNTQSNISFSRRINDQRIMFVFNSTVDNLLALTFTLVDDNMQIIWTKTVKTTYQGWEYNTSSYSPDLVVDAEGNFYYVANNLGFTETRKVLVYKMDANGDPLWLKINDVPGGNFYSSSATCTNTGLVVVIQGTPRSASVRLDKVTGQLLNAYTFFTRPNGSSYHRFLKYDNGRIYYGGNDVDFLTMGLFDTTGKPYRIKAINQNATGARTINVKNGNLFIGYSYYNGSVYKNVLFKTDTALSLLFSKEFNAGNQVLFGNNLEISDEGNIYSSGNYSHGGSNGSYYDQFFVKFDSSGNLGTCGSVNYTPPFIDINFDVQTAGTNPFVNTFVPVAPMAMSFTPDTMGHRISDILCSSAVLCNSINLTGTDIICQLNQPFTYHANRNPGCNGIATWIYDTTYAILQSYTDTSATFTFRIPGNTWLKTSISTGCSFMIDSILIQIQNSPQFFSLGADGFLCPGGTMQLHAGPGFSSYLWQDSSTDSVFTVTSPGMYHVQVNNLCGDEYRDTIIIAPAIIPALNIGIDTTVCYADTLQLTASPGFSNYAWQPAALINGAGQQVYVIPFQNEQITLIATTADGCKAYDTVNITSISARPVWLGNDTSFCQSGAVTLSAGTGYTQYTWSTGATTASITATQAGIYWVKAQDTNGCYAKDSFEIKQIYANPKPTLGSNFNICLNETKILDAGNYANYVWNTGATSQTITVNTIGDYWVQVTDNNNCKGVDSIILISILPLPSNFLKPADSICQRENLTISSLVNYISYLWSTGSTSPTIQVTSAGQYILTVNDNNSCEGKDTILVIAKNCTRAVYIPNAFTPNNDMNNDIFRATVYGTLFTFRLEVFNRYGQLVFITNDPLQGWDGNYKGKPQPLSTYTWRCVYQFAGKMYTEEKGTVILIR